MAESHAAERTKELVLPICEKAEVKLWDVVFKKEGTTWYLRIFIDKENGISIDDCEKVSRMIDPLLDKYDYIEQSYCLEVSSAGLDRQLKVQEHFDLSIGKQVDIKFYKPIEGQKELLDVKLVFRNDKITGIKVDNDSFEIDNKIIADIRLHVEF
jgi:ribosome maturation factor RimP